MGKMIAYCGLTCTDCPAYIATRHGDMEALAKMATEASGKLNVKLTAEDSMCDGCLATTGRQIGYCSECKIRTCGIKKEVKNCAHCADYACEKLTQFFASASKAKGTLKNIRTQL